MGLLSARVLPAWGILCVGVALTVFVTLSLSNQRQRSADLQFELHVNELRSDIEKRLRDHEQILLGGAGLFDVSDRVTRGEWRQYTERLELEDRYPGIQGVGYSQVIAPDELDAHIASIRQEGFPDYTVRPEGERALYTAIVYLEPFSDRNLAAFGYDMYSQSVRRDAMQRAVDTDQTTISGKVTLVQETHGREQAGFLMYVPIYRNAVPHSSAQERWSSLLGFVYSPYRMDDLMAGILGGRNLLVDFTLHDGEAKTPKNLMYNSSVIRTSHENYTPSHHTTLQIGAYGRVWTLTLQSRPAFQSQFVTPIDWLVPLLGGGISIVLFYLALLLLDRRERALALAEEMTRRRVESDERFEQLFLRLGQGVIIRSEEGDFLEANPAAQRILGLSLAQLQDRGALGKHLRLLNESGQDITLSDSPFSIAVNERRVVSNTVIRLEHPGSDNQQKWLEVDAYPLANVSGGKEGVGIFEVFSDITEQRAALEAVRDAERFLSSVLDAASEVAIIATDPRGVITVFNKGAENIFGYQSTEMVSKTSPAILTVDEEVESRAAELSAELGRPVEVFRVFVEKAEMHGSETREWTFIHKEGHFIPVSMVVTTMRDEQGDIVGYLGIAEDITERKRLDRMKSEFVSTVSHELRTPLTSISGALGLLVSGRLGDIPERAESMLETAHRNSLRLGYLINDLLDIEKLAAGELHFDMKPQALRPLLEQAVEANHAYGAGRQVALSLECPDSDIMVSVDGQRLLQVMANLLSNAIKYSPDGGTVTLDVTKHSDVVVIGVADQGPGIPESFRDRIFEKFTQADASDARVKEGTGLGLAITRELVERMNGRIDFTSTVGKGSRFYFELPLLRSVSSGNDTDASGKRDSDRPVILVVEDDPDVARLLSIILVDAGYEVDVALTAPEALSAAEQRVYDLISMDLDLAGQNGLDVIRQVRLLPGLSDQPFVVVSGKVEEGRLSMSGEASNIAWLDKPIDQERLVDIVQKQLNNNGDNPLRILHVEDDADLHQVVAEMLGHRFDLSLVRSLSDARARLSQEHYDVVILDIGLPDGTGWDLLPEIRSKYPDTRVVILSGNEVSGAGVGKVEAVLIKSRVSSEELLSAIKSRIERSRSRAVNEP